MKIRRANFVQQTVTDAGEAAVNVRAALERMHARDRENVVAGVIKASSLHLISAADTRKAKVKWTPATAVRFKG